MARQKKDTGTRTTGPVSSLRALRAQIGKMHKDDDPGVDVDPNSLRESRPHLKTGSVVLDYLIGGSPNQNGVAPCPGWPCGAISNLYGHESSGKTTIALEAAAQVCAGGGQVVFVDWEHALSLDYAQKLGVPVEDPDHFYLVQPNTLEQGIQVIAACTEAGVELIILDSVGAGVPKIIREQKADEKGSLGRVGIVAAIWSSVLPQLATIAHRTGTHIMGLSQLRKNINTTGYGENTTHQGGDAWKFYSSIRMSLRKVGGLKAKEYDPLTHTMSERVTTQVVRATIKKSKISNSQQREAEFHITFGEGVDNTRDLIAVGTNHKIVVKGGAWYTFETSTGQTIRGQGLPSFRKDILSTPGAYKDLSDRVFAAMQAGGAGAPLTVPVEDEEDLVEGNIGFISE